MRSKCAPDVSDVAVGLDADVCVWIFFMKTFECVQCVAIIFQVCKCAAIAQQGVGVEGAVGIGSEKGGVAL